MKVGVVIPIGLFSVYVLIKLGGYLTDDNMINLLVVSFLLYGSIISTIVVIYQHLKGKKNESKRNLHTPA